GKPSPEKQGKSTRHPMAPTCPETMLTTVTFAEEGPNETRVTIEWEPVNATEAEITTFTSARAGMSGGWTTSLDNLEEALGA
ncbi:SRPBCC domain-containing protein, partial [Leptospira sp. SA-E8]|uniref:SRPBCC domain-containing protein n=1 Tax=Leptospira sp. SA-E8 TaxID=3422259 RepID=UPI003EB7CE98